MTSNAILASHASNIRKALRLANSTKNAEQAERHLELARIFARLAQRHNAHRASVGSAS